MTFSKLFNIRDLHFILAKLSSNEVENIVLFKLAKLQFMIYGLCALKNTLSEQKQKVLKLSKVSQKIRHYSKTTGPNELKCRLVLDLGHRMLHTKFHPNCSQFIRSARLSREYHGSVDGNMKMQIIWPLIFLFLTFLCNCQHY